MPKLAGRWPLPSGAVLPSTAPIGNDSLRTAVKALAQHWAHTLSKVPSIFAFKIHTSRPLRPRKRRVCVCVCVCVRERERERERVFALNRSQGPSATLGTPHSQTHCRCTAALCSKHTRALTFEFGFLYRQFRCVAWRPCACRGSWVPHICIKHIFCVILFLVASRPCACKG